MQSEPPSQPWGGSLLFKADTKSEKLDRLEQNIPRLVKKTEETQDRMECANENLRSDCERWKTERQADLKNLQISMANMQISHYQQLTNAWEEVLAGLKLDNGNANNV